MNNRHLEDRIKQLEAQIKAVNPEAFKGINVQSDLNDNFTLDSFPTNEKPQHSDAADKVERGAFGGFMLEGVENGVALNAILSLMNTIANGNIQSQQDPIMRHIGAFGGILERQSSYPELTPALIKALNEGPKAYAAMVA
jgi:hypothetical protein